MGSLVPSEGPVTHSKDKGKNEGDSEPDEGPHQVTPDGVSRAGRDGRQPESLVHKNWAETSWNENNRLKCKQVLL